jgi:hypothetical protein
MKLSRTHLKRYKEIAGLFWKYGRSDLVAQMGIDPEDQERQERAEKKKQADAAVDDPNFKRNSDAAAPTATTEKVVAAPDQLVDDLEAMVPT